MTDSPEEFDRRLGEQLGQLADTPLPGRRSVDEVASLASESRTPMRRWLLPVAAAVALGVVATMAVVAPRLDRGFGGESFSAEPSAVPSSSDSAVVAINDPMPFVELLRVIVYDYEPVDSPRALAENSDLVVVGRIRIVRAGPPGENGRPPPSPMTTDGMSSRSLRPATIEIDIETVLAGDPGLVVDGRVYVRVPRVAPAEELNAVLPTGRVLLFLYQVADADTTAETSSRPAGAPLFDPPIQGFWIESPDSVVGAYAPLRQGPPNWSGLETIDELIEAARD